MDKKSIESDIKNYKIREGYLFKRSKFLKDWRKRWVVLTTNYIYTFTSNKLEDATDVIDLKDIKTYKSYLRKDEDMVPAGFKIRCNDDMFYFSANDCNEKWSWLVSLERLMDYFEPMRTRRDSVRIQGEKELSCLVTASCCSRLSFVFQPPLRPCRRAAPVTTSPSP